MGLAATSENYTTAENYAYPSLSSHFCFLIYSRSGVQMFPSPPPSPIFKLIYGHMVLVINKPCLEHQRHAGQ